MTALRERLPCPGWRPMPVPLSALGEGQHSGWTDGRLRVISSLIVAEMPDGDGTGPQWHVSITDRGERPNERQCRRALKAFGMWPAEEDNHHPGHARHFWRPVDPARRVDCECKVDEPVHVEPDGYRWSGSRTECRGCELERLLAKAGRPTPCPIHGAPEVTP